MRRPTSFDGNSRKSAGGFFLKQIVQKYPIKTYLYHQLHMPEHILLSFIEERRKKMVELALKRGFLDKDVLYLSQEIDRWIFIVQVSNLRSMEVD